jgi:hypothetical protein
VFGALVNPAWAIPIQALGDLTVLQKQWGDLAGTALDMQRK